MKGDEQPAGTVIVYHQVMNAKHAFAGQYNFFNLSNQFRGRCFAKKGRNRFFSCLIAGVKNKQTYNQTAVTFQIDVEEVADERAAEYCCGGKHIAYTVRAGGF